jgi:hypothetical protein
MSVGTPVQVRLPPDELDALDGYRRDHINPPTRGQAARELIRFALSEGIRLGKVQAEGAGA